MIDEDKSLTHAYYKSAREKQLFVGQFNLEAMWLAPVLFYVLSTEIEKAKKAITDAELIITSEEHGFYPFFNLFQLMFGLRLHDWTTVERLIETMEDFLQKRLYLRENGIFLILKGIYHLYQNQFTTASDMISEGLSVLKQAHSHYHYLLGLSIFRFFTARELYRISSRKTNRKGMALLQN